MCIAAVATALTAVAAFKGAQAEKSAQNYQAQVASANAATSEAFAVDAIARGNIAVADTRRKGDQTLGAQRAGLAARGLDTTSGSALALLQDTDYFTRLDESTVRSNAAREAWGYKVQETNYKNQASFAKSRADQISPFFSAVAAGVAADQGAGGGNYLGDGKLVAQRWYGSTFGPGNSGGDLLSQGNRRAIGVG